MWTEKYKPSKLEEIIGNNKAVEAVRHYNWRKPLLLHGAPGVGKSSLVNALAMELNFQIVEVNNENMDQASSIGETSSLYGGRRLIVIDNVDKIKDLKKLAKFLEATKNPTILITSDAKNRRLKTIKTKCMDLQMRRPMATTIANYLSLICKKEGLKAEKEILLEIGKYSKGDLRIALTDLESASMGRTELTEKDLEVLSARDVEGDIYKTLSKVFYGKDFTEIVRSTWDVNERADNIIFWIEENVPNIITNKVNLEGAFNYLSRADKFLGRIMRRQYWGFLRYANPLMTAGVNVNNTEGKKAMFKFPSYFMKMGRSKGQRNSNKSLADKMKSKIHSSNNTIVREDIPLIKLLLKKNKVTEEQLVEYFDLTDDEVDYLAA